MRSIILITAVLLAGCDVPTQMATTGSAASVVPSGLTKTAIMAPTDPAALLALGAVKLDMATFTAKIVGKELTSVDNDWNWVISADGTQKSGPFDKSYPDDVGPWNWTNGQFCRHSAQGTTFRCSDVFMIGNILRFSDAEKPGTLSDWGVTF